MGLETSKTKAKVYEQVLVLNRFIQLVQAVM